MKYKISVRALCEFSARRGDLDLRFTPAPSALEGMEGHAIVRARRPAGYEKEISLSYSISLPGGCAMQVSGRADGYDPALNRLEEIKTFRGRVEAIPDNHRALHWAQAKTYAHLLCVARGLEKIQVALVYYDVDRRTETVLTEEHSAASLAESYQAHCACFAAWARQETAHRAWRDEALESLRFPFDAMHAGQRTLAQAVYKATMQSRHLLAQAPTGIGKTLGTLFPMLKAAARAQLDKIYFLTAKTPGRGMALHALALLDQTLSAEADGHENARHENDGASLPHREAQATPEHGLRLRVLELTARDKACEHPDKACHGMSCPLAKGFYDRLPEARAQAVARSWLDRAGLRAIALEHSVCPYWLTHDLAQWADVVVGDYNYYFDTSAFLRGLALSRQWRVGLLVDEAHNLLERARGMYSAQLQTAAIEAARLRAPAQARKPLAGLLRACRQAFSGQERSYQPYESIPSSLLGAMFKASAALSDFFAESQADIALPPDTDRQGMLALSRASAPARSTRRQPETLTAHDGLAALRQLHFDLLHFLGLAEVFGRHSVFDVALRPDRPDAGMRLTLRNVVPAPFLEPCLAQCHGAVLFSATLSPWDFYRDTLGLPEDTAWQDVDSPFHPDQLEVRIARGISTRYRDRGQSITPIVQLMARQYHQLPGNYLSYFSSFDYLEQVAAQFAAQFPQIPIWTQARRMGETERDSFLQRFTPSGAGIGFAVLGGAFSEGIDLPGQRLIGAFISTLGLPQVNDINEQLKRSMGAVFGDERGYDYTYFYPGLRKVVQAAGRVIRSDADRGVIHLIDDRYAQPRVQALLPRWWRIGRERG